MLKTTSMALIKKTKSNYLTLEAKQAFTQLRQALTMVPILHHFDSECYIQIKTDTSDYATDDILSQLAFNLGQWNSIVFFSRKKIPAKTKYKTHNSELLAIV